ncbi:MAG: SDR family NAD(P)-dependent oxidoreductase [Eubacteriales bacterium]|nr:SDR family NAD(P)-dependent oxidoreductase [Eubacteriales bacterium]
MREEKNEHRKTVLITGAGRGIGKAIALKFAEAGYITVLNSRTESELKMVSDEINELGGISFYIAGDISKIDTVKQIFEEIQYISREYNNENVIDVLINNAGVAHIGLFQDMTAEEWENIISTNLTSVFNTCHEAIPYMLKAGSGKIINISSVWGICGASCEVAYSASKGGINALTRALGKELAPSNISVNAIACGAIDTVINSQLDEEERKQLEEEIPIGRMGKTKEVAELCLKLTELSTYLTGEVIKLDGAWI